MPKIVDPVERRTRIADAVLALIERGGVAEASLRNVAAEAGLNVGSVRHYVDGHEGMLLLALQEMDARVERRITRRAEQFHEGITQQERTDLVIGLFEELLPLDDERRREVAAWLAFTEHSRVTPALQPAARGLIDAGRELARFVFTSAGAPDVDLAAESMAALVDGLTIALLHDPGRLTESQIRTLLAAQLAAGAAGFDAIDDDRAEPPPQD